MIVKTFEDFCLFFADFAAFVKTCEDFCQPLFHENQPVFAALTSLMLIMEEIRLNAFAFSAISAME